MLPSTSDFSSFNTLAISSNEPSQSDTTHQYLKGGLTLKVCNFSIYK